VSLLQLPPLSLYVHVPWCERKCPYCDFNSHESLDPIPEAAYVDALLRDLDSELPLAQGRELLSVFIGGGTPSLLSGKAVERLLEGISARLPLHREAEITLEANPGSAEAERFQAFLEAGVNRLSIGIQSFNDERLQALGRIHDSDQAISALEMALGIGFSSLNVDLMHGLPGQSTEEAIADLQNATAFRPPHLSWYQLTIEPNTAFHKRPPRLPAEHVLADIQSRGDVLLGSQGYGNYEVSAWALPGYRCHHNMNYWSFGDYLGIGAGAHGKITDPGLGEVQRRAKRRQPAAYLAADNPLAERRILDAEDLVGEFMLNALRLVSGFDEALFSARTGLPLAVIETPLTELAGRGLLGLDEEGIRATALGMRYLDSVVAEFF
jgi:oxygen-independent coproporphyrinogen-3 oxidase